jgi:hypothetical protein
MNLSSEKVSLTEQIRCAERELGKRQKLYPKWVREGRLNSLQADRELAAMSAVVQTLQSLREPDLPVTNTHS